MRYAAIKITDTQADLWGVIIAQAFGVLGFLPRRVLSSFGGDVFYWGTLPDDSPYGRPDDAGRQPLYELRWSTNQAGALSEARLFRIDLDGTPAFLTKVGAVVYSNAPAVV